jgi:lipopolysaccharide transport system permease protein
MRKNITVIEPRSGWEIVDWRELKDYRDLFYYWVWRNIKARYAQSVLGIGWAIIQPVFAMLVFTVVFGKLAKLDSDGAPYAIFSFAALVPWTYFSNAFSEAAGSLVTNTNMITKIYFPRIVLPLTSVISKLLDFGISFIILIFLLIVFQVTPTIGVLFIPVLVIIMMITASGAGMWFAALSIHYRDVKHGLHFMVQLLMYAAPVVYATSIIPEQYRLIYALNPMVGVIEGFRSALLGTNPMPWDLILVGTITSLLIFIIGALYFRRMERIFADVA